jgi:mannose-6-phosphate isomerase-like protein (cupin superfamily)
MLAREGDREESQVVSVHSDQRGALTVLDLRSLPFEAGRVFTIHDVPRGGRRGGHGHHTQDEVLAVVSGRARAMLDDGSRVREVELGVGDWLHIEAGTWHEIEALDKDLLVLVAVPGGYEPGDYFRDRAVLASEDADASTASQTASS